MFARMRSQNYRSFLAPDVTTGQAGTINCGDLLLVEDTWGVAFNATVATGDAIPVGSSVVLIYNCDKIMVVKTAGQGTAIPCGEHVYVVPTTLEVYGAATKADPADVCIGICTEPAVADDVLVEIDLKGDSMTDQA